MALIQLTQHSITVLAQLILLLLCTVYLIQKRSFRLAGNIMIAMCLSAIVYSVLQFADVSLPNLIPRHAFINAITYIPLTLCAAALIQFTYHFPIDSHRFNKESAIVFGISMVIAVVITLFTFLQPYQLDLAEVRNMGGAVLLQYFWAIGVTLRSYFTHLQQSDQVIPSSLYNPASRITRAFNHLLFILIGIPFVMSIPVILDSFQLITPDVPEMVLVIGKLIFIYFLVGIYLNHSWQRTSFLAQLLGSIVVTQLILICMAALIFAPRFSRTHIHHEILSERRTLAFSPAGDGYAVEKTPLIFDTDFGRKVDLADNESERIELPFSFPYFDQKMDELYLSDNRIVTFDQPADVYAIRDGLQAAIGVMGMDLDPDSPITTKRSGVYVKTLPDQVMMTWFQLPLKHGEKPNSAQLILNASGEIRMALFKHEKRAVYDLRPIGAPWFIGLHTGKYNEPPHLVSFEEHTTHGYQDGRSIIEDYQGQYREFLHDSMWPILVLLIVGIVITFAGFPLFIGYSILRPVRSLVDAVREINQGNLDVALRVRRNDEIGYLTDSFNQMIASIRDKNDQLNEYSNHLETRVQQRTAMLAEMTEKAEKARKEAIEANQTKSAFLANITHEIRTPLNAIIGFSDILREDVHDAGRFEWEGDLVRIRDAANDLLGMINNILDISKIEAGRTSFFYDEIDLEHMAAEIIEFLRLILQENNNKASYAINAKETVMIGDYMKIRQILQNLLSNAAKFTQDGVIQLLIDRVREKGRSYYLIQVRDTGIGMTGEQIDRVFEPFQQADNSITRDYGGSGLGLAISRQYAEMMGGRLWVKSKSGVGSTFFLVLPVKPPSSAEVARRIKENGKLML